MGTAWILDYQLPEEGHYPTVWYIATVAHTIRRFRFLDNKYQQALPISIENTNKLREEIQQQDFSKLSLYGNWEKNCELSAKQGYFDFNISRQENGEELQAEFGAIHNNKIKTPKLFYTSIDLWEANPSLNIPRNNYKDFAVLEIEFIDEEYAKKVTGNFAEKYPISATNALNIFSGPLDSRYSWEEIDKLNENFYNLAYPSKPKVFNKYNYTVAFDEEKAEAFKLSNDPKNWYKTTNKKLNGHVASKGLWEFKWNGKEKVDIGHHYLLKIDKELRMGVGASGSLYADKEGNVLGIHGGGEFWGEHSFVIPLRSNGISLEGTIQTPKYDLILGSKGQTSSYREQIEKYNKNTWLRAREWKHKS